MNIEKLRTDLEVAFPEFKNFRDISFIPNRLSSKIKLKEKLLYRSSSLAKYDNNHIKTFIKIKDIDYIIDLRDENEIKTYDFNEDLVYSNDFSKKYVRNIPLNPFVKEYLKNEPYKNLYYAIIKDYTHAIGLIFKLFTNVGLEKLIIHCQAGVDRTGIIIALLYELLGLEREYILIDYIVSRENDIEVDNLTYMLNLIDNKYGGILNYLNNYCKITIDLINTIKNSFLF
jgi:protein tyrosine/serine phosphatase